MSGEFGSGVAMRDLDGARKAYEDRDVEASKAAHDAKVHQEHHSKVGEKIKSIVFGGLDGIITTFAVVAGAAGGGLGVDIILILGFSSVFADAISMGVGDALSSKAENEFIMAEREREMWEYKSNKEGEIVEMIDLYESKGMSRDDAEACIRRMAEYPDFFVDVMMAEELELRVPDPDDNPWWDGAVTFGSFVVFGTVPLLAYVVFYSAQLYVHEQFIVSVVLTACTLFALGVTKSRFTKQLWWKAGFEVFLLGGGVAAIAYLIGWFMNSIVLGGTGGSGGVH